MSPTSRTGTLAAKTVASTGARRATAYLAKVDQPEGAQLVSLTTRALGDAAYRFDQYRSKPPAASTLNQWTLVVAEKSASLRVCCLVIRTIQFTVVRDS